MLEVPDNNAKEKFENGIVGILSQQDDVPTCINNYGETILHISAANGLLNIVKEITKKNQATLLIHKKSRFGWTPLMHAIRNRHFEVAKHLVEKSCMIQQSNYLGIATITIAAAISKEMFMLMYQNDEKQLEHTATDDVNPLCVAAMKNDKDLFFTLLKLGVNASKANNFTQIMMRKSTIPEIAWYAKRHIDDCDDYWNDTSDNIEVRLPETAKKRKHEFDSPEDDDNNDEIEKNIQENNSDTNPAIIVEDLSTEPVVTEKTKKRKIVPSLNLLIEEELEYEKSVISPVLLYKENGDFPASPSAVYLDRKEIFESYRTFPVRTEIPLVDPIDEIDSRDLVYRLVTSTSDVSSDDSFNFVRSDSDADVIDFTPSFSPSKPWDNPGNVTDKEVFDQSTPTPPQYRTPARRVALNSQQVEMVLKLQEYGLSHYIPNFLENEIDIDLFLVLNDKDLIEIGIDHKADRGGILAVIEECKKSEL